jgi:hypothetical protein
MPINDLHDQSAADEQYVRAVYPDLSIVEDSTSVRIFVRDRSFGPRQFLAEGMSMGDAWKIARKNSAQRWSRLFGRFWLFS